MKLNDKRLDIRVIYPIVCNRTYGSWNFGLGQNRYNRFITICSLSVSRKRFNNMACR